MAQNITLRQWIPEWLRCYKLGTIQESSYHQLEILADKIPDSLLDSPLNDIRPMHLQEFINEFSHTASKSYIDKMSVMIKSLFSAAVENDYCRKSPTNYLKIPKVSEAPREAFSADEVKIIIDYAMSYSNRRTAVAIITLLLTGLRRGELLGLKWSDLTDISLTVNRSISVQKGIITFTEHKAKTKGSLRTLPLIPELSFLLHSLPHNGEFIFPTSSGKLMTPRNFSRDYRNFFIQLREVAPEVRYLSPHCCRHTFATLTLLSGSDIRVVQELLGHSDIKSTARYTHPDEDAKRLAVDNLRSSI